MNESDIGISVRLKLFHDFIDIKQFFLENNIPFSTVWDKGDEIVTPNGFHTGKYKSEFGITIESTGSSDTAEEDLKILLRSLHPYKDILQKFIDHNLVYSVFCIGITNKESNRVGIFFNRDILSEIREYRAEIDIDIY